jgi:hypothetical protein
MKIRRSILFLTVIATLLVALALWYGKKKPVEMPSAISTETNIAPLESGESRSPVAAPVIQTNAPAVNTGAATIAANVPKPPAESKTERMREVLSTYNDVPIDFYGKLEDQFGNPVAGAEIKGSIRVISGVRQSTDWLTTTSDANGLFQFHGRGQDISTMPSKKGYALASLNGGGNYSMLAPEEERAHPDPNNPVVVKMWKLQGAEPLLSIDQQYKLHYTGTPVSFDLVAGKIVSEGGDVKITVNRPPGVISGRNPQDWSLQIEAVNGGLMDSRGQEAVTYAAPDNGYQPSEAFTMSTTSNSWYQAVHQSFFLTSRNGQIYGKLRLSFHINSEPDGFMNVSFGGVVNTNGSRNFEGDPNTMNTVAR